jgi:Xaa-Pro aminopeptidase
VERLEGAVAVLPSAPQQTRSNDTHFPYRQDNDFYYLTGFAEPQSVAVIAPGRPEGEFVLFVRARDPERETWDGRRAGVEGARCDYGADQTFTIDELATRLPVLLEPYDEMVLPSGRNAELERAVLEARARTLQSRPRRGTGPVTLREGGAVLSEMRLRKEEPELVRLRRACAITCEGLAAAMKQVRPGMGEHEVEALLGYVYRARGGMGPGYGHIVAGGANATILHYEENRDLLRDGDLLLIDSGCEFDYYTADVTRTFPIGRTFSREQRAIYDVVLEAHREALAAVGPGKPFDAAHQTATTVIARGLVRLGILKGEPEELVAHGACKPFFMHRTGHWLGMDVHDCGTYVVGGTSRTLEPGMVLTVEPGLYFGEWCGDVDPKWRGIGVRIEDDVLVTAKGNENLTAACPVDPVEIEKLRAVGDKASPLEAIALS